MTNGSSQSLEAGSGIFAGIGFSAMPLWFGDTLGLGAGTRIGVKYDSIDATNASMGWTRFPFSAWLQAYLRMSTRWYFTLAGGPHKELDPKLSGSGDLSVANASFQSPWGWFGEGGLLFAETWHTAVGFSVRYTQMYLNYGGSRIDASNVGLAMSLQLNP